MQNPSGKPYHGIPQMPYQCQQFQIKLFQPFQDHLGTRQHSYIYLDYQTPPYPRAQILVAQTIPSYRGYPPPDFNRMFPFIETLEFPYLMQLTNDPICHLLDGQ